MGCRAQSLGIEVRQGGLESLSVEDLQRDSWMFENGLEDRGPGGKDEEMAAERTRQRFQDMRAVPAFGRAYKSRSGSGPWRTCARKNGAEDGAVLWIALDSGQGAMGGAIPRAVLISLAKAWDTYQEPERELIFCALAAEGGIEDYLASPAHPLASTSRIVSFGPLGSGEMLREEGTWKDIPSVHFSTAGSALGTAEDRLEAVDYREILKHI
jgi:hypothetical protein